MRFFFLAVALALAACGADDASEIPDRSQLASSSSSSGGGFAGSRGDGGASNSGGSNAGDAGLPNSCEGSCRESSLELRKDGTSVRFERVRFGFDRTSTYPKLKLSADHGAGEACPTQDESPSHVVQLAGVPAPFDGSMFESGAGITATLYDFVGDVVAGSTGVLKGTRIEVTPSAANLEGDDVFVAFDLHLEFEQGIVVDGHAFATHCSSIDQR